MRRSLISLVALGAALAGPAMAQENCGEELNYEDADIRVVVDEIAIRTGRTFIVDPAVQGRVTIKSPPNGGICVSEAWELFQAALRANDFVATPIGNGKYRIIPLQEGSRNAGMSSEEGVGLDLVTQIVRLSHIDAREAAANLAQIVGTNAVVSPVRSGNAVILVDTASNVARLEAVLRELDQDPTVFKTLTLEHAAAGDVARVVTDLARELSEEQGNGRASFSVVAVDASNSLLVRAEPNLMRRIENVVRELDQFGEAGANLVVVKLKHTNAEDLAPLLTEVANSTAGIAATEGAQTQRNRASVSFHIPTNSVIINGSADVQRTLQNVIAQLDVRQPQVLVEAIIVDMSDTLARDLGVQYFVTGENIPFTATNFSGGPNILPAAGTALLQRDDIASVLETPNTATITEGGVVVNTTTESLQSQLATQALQSLLGFTGIGIGGGFEFGNGNFFGGILTALQADSESNVLSTPSVVTVNNKTARLQVGQEIPITTGEAIGNDFQNAFRTINREEVGVILEVTPQINDGGVVTLEITQEISSVAGPINATSTDLITNKREITTTALVDSGEILVVGGLIDEQRALSEEKVPFLGDLPGVGNLFKSTSRSNTRQNLMVFIRPTIIRDKETAARATRKKFDYIRARELLNTGDSESHLDRLVDRVTGVEMPGDTPRSTSVPEINASGDQ